MFSPSEAGFQNRDLVTAINDIETSSMQQVRLTLLNEYLKNPNLTLHVTTDSGNQVSRSLDLSDTLLLADEKDYFSKTGMGFWQPPHTTIINSVLADKPAAKAGLMAQDEVISVDGQAVSSTQFFSDYINSSAGKSIDIKVLRDNAEKTLSMTPMLTEIEGQQRVVIGVGLARKFDQEAVNELFFIEEAPFFQAIKLGVVETWDMSIMTLKVMGRLITGEASLKNISGPITIANYAGKSALIGFSAFLTLFG